MTVYAEALLSRRAAVGRAALWVGAAAAVALFPGCRQPATPLVRAGTYGDTPEELHRLWSAILAACQSDDRGRVHDLLASLIMTQAELAELIGPQKASELWPRYQAMMGSLCNAGAVELVAHVYEKKYDDVSVTRIDPPSPKASSPPARPTAPGEAAAPAPAEAPEQADLNDLTNLTDTDRAVQKALLRPMPFYTVRIKKKTEAKGLRYDFFVYQNGFWRSGNLLGKFLTPPPPLPGSAR